MERTGTSRSCPRRLRSNSRWEGSRFGYSNPPEDGRWRRFAGRGTPTRTCGRPGGRSARRRLLTHRTRPARRRTEELVGEQAREAKGPVVGSTTASGPCGTTLEPRQRLHSLALTAWTSTRAPPAGSLWLPANRRARASEEAEAGVEESAECAPQWGRVSDQSGDCQVRRQPRAQDRRVRCRGRPTPVWLPTVHLG